MHYKQVLDHLDNDREGIHDRIKEKPFLREEYFIHLENGYDSLESAIYLNKDPTSVRYIKVIDLL